MAIQTTAPKHLASDGKEFNSRKEAEAHESVIIRTERMVALLTTLGTLPDAEELVAEVIAKNADAIIAALNNPLGKGRKTKAAPAPAPAAEKADEAPASEPGEQAEEETPAETAPF